MAERPTTRSWPCWSRTPSGAPARELDDLPPALVDRLRHYFETYKQVPGTNPVVIDAVYGREHAETVVRAAMADWQAGYGALAAMAGGLGGLAPH